MSYFDSSPMTKYKGFISHNNGEFRAEGIAIQMGQGYWGILKKIVNDWPLQFPHTKFMMAEHHGTVVVVSTEWDEVIKFVQIHYIGTEDKVIGEVLKHLRKALNNEVYSFDTYTLEIRTKIS